MRGNFGLKLQNSPKLPHIHARFHCNSSEQSLSRNYVAPLRHKLPESWLSVTCPELKMSRNIFVAVIVARSRTDFYFSQRLRQQKNCETCSFQSMLHLATIRATFLVTRLLDKLQEKLPSVKLGPVARIAPALLVLRFSNLLFLLEERQK